MNPEIVLVLGCWGLGLTIAYGLWAVARADVLKVDLWRIIADLDVAVKVKGAEDNTVYLASRSFMVELAKHSAFLSPSLWILVSRFDHRPAGPAHSTLPSIDPAALANTLEEVRGEILRALALFVLRILAHFLFSPVDAMVILWVLIMGRTGVLTSWLAALWKGQGIQGRCPPIGHLHPALAWFSHR